MENFSSNEVARELIDSLSAAELLGLNNAIECFRTNFEYCDFYPAYSVDGNKNLISIGVRDINNSSGTHAMFRIRPGRSEQRQRTQISLSTRSRGGLLQQIIEELELDLDISKDSERREFQSQCSFFLDELSKSTKELSQFLVTVSKFSKFTRCMTGQGNLPDDYLHDIGSLGDDLEVLSDNSLISEVDDVINNTDLREYEKKALAKQRIGHSKFARGVKEFGNGSCLINPKYKHNLIASHIKPWADSLDGEKVDVANGLCLSPNFDGLFEDGLISFKDNGTILVSSRLDAKLIDYGLTGEERIKIAPKQGKYLRWHRNNKFVD
jgi:hypothetical protein